MKLLSLLTLVVGLVAAQSSTSSSMDMAMSGMSMSESAAASTSTSPDYTITALPAVQSAPSCVFNCLIPIGLADPSGCDDVSEDCACLSAPADVLNFLTECVNTVCPSSSSSAYGASATSLYGSYCQSVYGNATIAQAFSAESSADAAAAASSSIASVEASSTNAGASSSATSSASGFASASSTAKSGSSIWSPSV